MSRPVRWSEWAAARPRGESPGCVRDILLLVLFGLGFAALSAALTVRFPILESGKSILFMLSTYIVWAIVGRARGRRLAQRMDAGEGETAVSVTYGIREGDRSSTFGRDEGMLVHIDGWLHFRGGRTQWSVPSDMAGAWPVYESPSGPCVIVMSAIGGESPFRSTRELRTILAEWGWTPSPEGPAVLPPYGPAGRWPMEWDRWLNAYAPAIAIAIAGLLALLLRERFGIATAVGGGLFGLAVIVAVIIWSVHRTHPVTARRKRMLALAREAAIEPDRDSERPRLRP